MEKKVKTVCITVGFLGLLSAALAFAAEAKRIKKSQILYTTPSECTYPRSPALALALTAAVALLIAQTITNVMTGCLCCRRGSFQASYRWTVALLCSVISWFTFLIGFLILLIGAALNDEKGESYEDSSYYMRYCYVVEPGVFAIAAALSLATVVLGTLSYVIVESSKNGGDPLTQTAAPIQPAIAMGQPQQRSQEPVFVHEDTYMRRQVA